MADLEAVLELTRRGGAGLTNLPPHRETLERRIALAEAALDDEQARADGAPIMLVAEFDGAIVATGMIFARVGAEWPFYSYRITRQAALSRSLARSKSQRLLNLVNDFDGETEVGGLFVDPGMRGMALGQLMARSRYMFMATHRDWFGERVIAELRGYQDSEGRSRCGRRSAATSTTWSSTRRTAPARSTATSSSRSRPALSDLRFDAPAGGPGGAGTAA
jgi:arginine N-succinyltransferase